MALSPMVSAGYFDFEISKKKTSKTSQQNLIQYAKWVTQTDRYEAQGTFQHKN